MTMWGTSSGRFPLGLDLVFVAEDFFTKETTKACVLEWGMITVSFGIPSSLTEASGFEPNETVRPMSVLRVTFEDCDCLLAVSPDPRLLYCHRR